MIHSLTEVPGIEQCIRDGTRQLIRQGPTYPIKVPSFDATLWRYMDFVKFVSLLEHEMLFFVRADQLSDPYEGAWSDASRRAIGLGTSNEPDPDESVNLWRSAMKMAKPERRFMLVNCWHNSTHESEAMWKLYAGKGYGLAVKTDFKTLVHSFTDRLPDMVAKVEYVCYESYEMPQSLWAPLLHKRLGFVHEREVRAIIVLGHQERAHRAAHVVRDVGMRVPVDPSDLIQEVVVSPYGEDWMLELVERVCTRYGIDAPVKKSSMAKVPSW